MLKDQFLLSLQSCCLWELVCAILVRTLQYKWHSKEEWHNVLLTTRNKRVGTRCNKEKGWDAVQSSNHTSNVMINSSKSIVIDE